jgi:hypothetical protein
MLDTMHCLQVSLVPEATGLNPSTCHELEEKAFRSHAECYVDNGFCELGFDDWRAIVEIVDLRTLFESFDAFKATVEAAFGCAEFAAFMILKGLFR